MTRFTSNSHSLIQTKMWALRTKTILQSKKKLSLEDMDLTTDILMWSCFYTRDNNPLSWVRYLLFHHESYTFHKSIPFKRVLHLFTFSYGIQVCNSALLCPKLCFKSQCECHIGMGDLTLTSDFLAFRRKPLNMTGPSFCAAIVLCHSMSYTKRQTTDEILCKARFRRMFSLKH